MRAIRNFIYNFSDIFVALIIIALAAFLIWTRVEVIMDYPSSQSGTAGVSTSVQADLQADNSDADSASAQNSDTEYKEVVIPEGSSTDVVAGLLKQAGLVVNIDDFTYQIKSMGLDGKVQPGVHQIPRGVSMEEVINILCGVDSGTEDNTDSGTKGKTDSAAE
ncbi:MAG: hypothetical protein Q4C14_07525 [Bacillota bacterium]|nr:hypothetical protein [Bacillota bacterium]